MILSESKELGDFYNLKLIKGDFYWVSVLLNTEKLKIMFQFLFLKV